MPQLDTRTRSAARGAALTLGAIFAATMYQSHEVDAGQTTRVTIIAFDEATGRPTYARIDIEPAIQLPGLDFSAELATGADGIVEFFVPEGPYRLRIRAVLSPAEVEFDPIPIQGSSFEVEFRVPGDMPTFDEEGDGIDDEVETLIFGTEAFEIDGDNDGMSDEFEIAYQIGEQNPESTGFDPDNDGLTNLEEYLAGTNPRVANDKRFVDIKPAIPGSVIIAVRDVQNTFPISGVTVKLDGPVLTEQVTDNQGVAIFSSLPAGSYVYELLPSSRQYLEQLPFPPAVPQTFAHGDGVTIQNLVMVARGAGSIADRDSDGLSDAQETDIYNTNPDEPDSDFDGLPDDVEVRRGLAPLSPNVFPDTNSDGRINTQDLQDVINTVLRTSNSPRADVDRDGVFTAIDIQVTINYVLGIAKFI